jgi:hypothetical protein
MQIEYYEDRRCNCPVCAPEWAALVRAGHNAPRRALEQAQAEIARLTEQRDALLETCEYLIRLDDGIAGGEISDDEAIVLWDQAFDKIRHALAKARGEVPDA